MRWNPELKYLYMNRQDYGIFKQCRMDINKFEPRYYRPQDERPEVAPVSSKLIYVMLVSECGGAYFWMQHRSILALARNHDYYYHEVNIPKHSGAYAREAVSGYYERIDEYLACCPSPQNVQ